MGWAPGPGGPSAAAVGMDGPGSPLPSRDSSHCLRGGGGSLAGLSRVCGWKKRRPSAWERLRCLTCFQSFSYGGSFPLVTYMMCGWEGGVGGGLKSKPPPPAVSPGAPSPRQPPPLEEDPRWWPRLLWTRDLQCPVPPTPGSADGRPGLDRGTTRPLEEAGPLWGRGPRLSLCPRALMGSSPGARGFRLRPVCPAWGTARHWGALDVHLSAAGPAGRRCGGLAVSLSETGLHPAGGARVWAPERPWSLGPRRPVPVRSPLPLSRAP